MHIPTQLQSLLHRNGLDMATTKRTPPSSIVECRDVTLRRVLHTTTRATTGPPHNAATEESTPKSVGQPGGDFHRVELDPLQVVAVPCVGFAAGAVNENAPHGFRCRTEEVAPPAPPDILAGKTQPGVMHQGGGLKGLAGLLESRIRVQSSALTVGARRGPLGQG